MRPIRALILDFDGVVLESNDLKTAAFEEIFARFPEHAAAMMAYHHSHVSDSRFTKFQYLVTARLGRRPDDPLVGELAAAFSEAMLQQIARCPMVPGAREFLDDVPARVPLFLASVTPQDELDAIVSQLGLTRHFTRVYGCPPWTKTSALTDIVAALGGPDGVVFIGDSAGDQRAAVATGVEFIARDGGLPFDAPPAAYGRNLHEVRVMIAPRLPRGPQEVS